MAELKTKPTSASPRAFVDAIPDEARRRDCRTLLEMMRGIAGEPRMWGDSIVGFGSHDYRYPTGRTGTWFLTGFSPRKRALTVYLMLDLDRMEERLAALGKHRHGRGCLYIKRLADIDTAVLKDLIRLSCAKQDGKSCGGAHQATERSGRPARPRGARDAGPGRAARAEPMRVGVDSGGTFTDFAAWDGARLRSFKVRSTPRDPAQAILAGLERLAAAEVVHGSTVATNALLQRSGARTAFVATQGFEDLLDLARQRRAELYNWTPSPRRPLVEDRDKHGIAERVLHDGTVLEALDESDIPALARRLGDVPSVAVCLLHSYANPEHERRLGEALRRAGYAVSLSSEILPEYREYERASTTVVNAYVSPIMRRYISSLERALPGARLRIFQSNGGSISVSEASGQAVRTVLSGPAGGLVGAAEVARLLGIERFVSFDMGGTSTDVSLYDGAPRFTTEGEAAGLPVRVPMLDIESIGAGGGSVAYFDEGSALRVGPRSAGAEPGPACYGTGEELTVTDANLLLGRIDTESFLAGTIRLDAARAREVAARAAAAGGTGIEELARAIVRAANARMERAIRAVSVERGHDPREYAMICFGGAGSLHACELAAALEIPRVVVPAHAGVLSALGMLVADCVRDYSESVLGADPGPAFERLAATARRDMRERGFDAVALIRTLDMRYEGQSYEINVAAGDAPDFDRIHERRYGYRHAGRAKQAVTARVRAVGRTAEKDKPNLAASCGEPRFASVYVPDGWRCRETIGSNAIIERAD